MTRTAIVSSVRRAAPAIALLVSLAATFSACVSTGTPRRSSASATRSARILTAEELGEIDARATSLYDALAVLRPWFLQPFPARDGSARSGPAVYVDGLFYGSVNALRQIPLQWVREVRLLRGADATIAYGAHRPGMVLEVITRASTRGRAP